MCKLLFDVYGILLLYVFYRRGLENCRIYLQIRLGQGDVNEYNAPQYTVNSNTVEQLAANSRMKASS